MEKEIIIDDVITAEQKKKFFQFALDIYTKKIEKIYDGFNLTELGFCHIYHYFFCEYTDDFELLPELRRHKPRKKFYDFNGNKTKDKNQFWFPAKKNNKRIEICEKILKKLNK